VLDARPAPPGILLIGLHGRLSDDHSGASLHGRGVSLEEIRVPLLWRPPRTVAGPMVGRRITRPVSALDVAPTLLEAAAVKPLGAAEGRPLPLADPARHEAPTRVIRAEHPREIAIVVGAEYLAASRERTEAGSPKEVRSALLWSPGERTRESLPALDPPGVSAERLARLGPQLEAALGADVPSD
jgi:hypothetical protein